MYQQLIQPLLFNLPPETAHQLTLRLAVLAGRLPPIRALVKSSYATPSASKINIFGLTFPNFLGLAAGYDKDAQAIMGLSALGFGHIEIGTITPRPQTGNPKPRVFRLPGDQAIINRMGFPGKGVEHCCRVLAKTPKTETLLGINIGKNKDTPLEFAAQDYTLLISRLAAFADYFAINISSPNTIGLRKLQHHSFLDSLLQQIVKVRDTESQNLARPLPLLVKLSPDLEINALDQALEVILSHKIDGIIATNTTTSRTNLTSLYAQEPGGLSGKPLKTVSTSVIKHIHQQTGGKIPIVGVGGVFSHQDAQEKLQAGASLVQIYTGLIYQGPRLVRSILDQPEANNQ